MAPVILVEVTKNTRGRDSRAVTYKAIGKWIDTQVKRRTKPVFNADGTPKLDAEGEPVTEKIGKDEPAIIENTREFISDGVLDSKTDGMANALALVGDDEQILLDCFADGYNERAYSNEANKDELDDFLAAVEMGDKDKDTLKRAVRQVAKGTGDDLLEVAEYLKARWIRNKAKAEAAAAAGK